MWEEKHIRETAGLAGCLTLPKDLWKGSFRVVELEDIFVSERAKLARRRYVRSWVVGFIGAIISGVVVTYIVRLIDAALTR